MSFEKSFTWPIEGRKVFFERLILFMVMTFIVLKQKKISFTETLFHVKTIGISFKILFLFVFNSLWRSSYRTKGVVKYNSIDQWLRKPIEHNTIAVCFAIVLIIENNI